MAQFQVTNFKNNLNTLSSLTYKLERWSANLVGTPPLCHIENSLLPQLPQLFAFLILEQNNGHKMRKNSHIMELSQRNFWREK